jgi:hypothetical protein
MLDGHYWFWCDGWQIGQAVNIAVMHILLEVKAIEREGEEVGMKHYMTWVFLK